MKRWTVVLLVGIGAQAMLFGCDPKTKGEQATTTTSMRTPVAYGALDIPSTTTRYSAFVATYQGTATSEKADFDYFIADPHLQNPQEEDSRTEPFPPASQKAHMVNYRGGVIAYFFRGWGYMRNEHLMTASLSRNARPGNAFPFGVYPVSKDRYVVLTFGIESDDATGRVTIMAIDDPSNTQELPPMSFIYVDVRNGVVKPIAAPQPYDPVSGLNYKDDVETAHKVITGLRDKMELP